MHVINLRGDMSFRDIFTELQNRLVDSASVEVGEWQSQKIDMPMRELREVIFEMDIPANMDDLAIATGAHRPWAEDHFEERAGGEPLNPAPSEAWWPFRKKSADGNTNADHKSEGAAFSHTYPERMWPKFANGNVLPMEGVRFAYGDLMDVVKQLQRSPYTRQAFLPIWFPEDTGAVHGKRVPCTLGYQFTIRDGKLDITYFMRSTDLLRHLQDDIYLAGRLAQWMVEQVLSGLIVTGYNFKDPQPDPLVPGKLTFHTVNLHIFEMDVPAIEYRKTQGQLAWPE